jgi:hypothetical protein
MAMVVGLSVATNFAGLSLDLDEDLLAFFVLVSDAIGFAFVDGDVLTFSVSNVFAMLSLLESTLGMFLVEDDDSTDLLEIPFAGSSRVVLASNGTFLGDRILAWGPWDSQDGYG